MKKCSESLVGLGVMAAVLCGCEPVPIGVPRPPTQGELVGTWYALSSYRAYRLDLHADGSAFFAALFHPNEKEVYRYRAEEWQLDGRHLSIVFQPLEASEQELYFRAEAFADDGIWRATIKGDDIWPIAENEEFARESSVTKWFELLSPRE